MIKDLSFLGSRRFWCLVGIAITGVLSSEGILSVEIANAIVTILGGFTVVRTLDRFNNVKKA